MFYHIQIGITGLTSWVEKNKTKDECLLQFVCPYVNREVTLWDGRIFNMSSCGNVVVYETDRPVDSDFPISKEKYVEKKGTPDETINWRYDSDLKDALRKQSKDITEQMFAEALNLIEGRSYVEKRRSLIEKERGKYSFFICPFDNAEVDHNYEFVIKPAIEKLQFSVQRADEIAHTRTITDVIISAINRSRFVIADLTEERPNCYYEVGYAHSQRKPVIILAKEGTARHFDLAAHKWIYWSNYKDLKNKFEKEIQGLLNELKV
jgi:hypothetical protein